MFLNIVEIKQITNKAFMHSSRFRTSPKQVAKIRIFFDLANIFLKGTRFIANCPVVVFVKELRIPANARRFFGNTSRFRGGV